jgi:hypothetical protein
MSLLSALASQAGHTPYLPATAQPDGRATPALASGNSLTQHPVVAPAALSDSGINLAQRSLAARADRLGNSTIDVAQQFINSFASQLFGDAAKGATVSFDSASIDTASSLTGALQHSSGPGGSSDAAAFSLNESADFIGKGKITTADGQTFDFEIEVKYESSIQAGVAQSTSAPAGPPPLPDQGAPGADAGAPPVRRLPDQAFPGSLDDLFKLLGRQLQTQLPPADGAPDQGKQGGQGGNLAVRLLKLIGRPTQLDGQASPGQAQTRAAAQAKALALAYGPSTSEAGDTPAGQDASKAAPAATTATTV